MGKAYTKGAKMREKRKLAGLDDLADVPRAKARGKKRAKEIAASAPDPDAPKVVLAARARHTGHTGPLAAMARPMLVEAAGQAISAVHGQERAHELWETYRALTAAEQAYFRRYVGQGLYPKTAKIEMEPERVETRADDRPDLRSEDERAREAVNTWRRWQGHIGHLDAHHRTAIFDVARSRVDAMADGGITGAGRRFVAAMGLLQKVVVRAK